MAETYKQLLDSCTQELQAWFNDEYSGDESEITEQITTIADEAVPVYTYNRIMIAIDANLTSSAPQNEPSEMTLDALAAILIYEELESDLNDLAGSMRDSWDHDHSEVDEETDEDQPMISYNSRTDRWEVSVTVDGKDKTLCISTEEFTADTRGYREAAQDITGWLACVGSNELVWLEDR